MKATLENKTNNETETLRGRPQIPLKLPKRKTGFTIKEAAEKNGVSEQVIRNRVNKMTNKGQARAVSEPVIGKRSHPQYRYFLVS